jgi:outer membrane lipoprotein-sorting protein
MKKRHDQIHPVDQMVEIPFDAVADAETAARLEKHLDAFRADLQAHPYVRRLERSGRAGIPVAFGWKLALSGITALAVLSLLCVTVLSPRPVFAFEDLVDQFTAFRPYRCRIITYRDGARVGIRDVYYGDLYRRRDESINVISGSRVISVYDRSNQPWKTLHIIPEDRFATEAAIEGAAPSVDPDSDLLHIIRQLKMNAVEDLGGETIDGIEARGFHGTFGGIGWTVWADPETELPVSVEKSIPDAGLVMKLTRFEFDAAFDESLFSTVAPEGYRVQKLSQDRAAAPEPQPFLPHSFTQVLELGGDVRSSKRMEYLTRSIRRQISPDGRIDVINMSESDLQQLTLYPDTNVAVKQKTEGFGSRKDPYCLDLLERVQADKNRVELGEKRIDGRPAYGIRSEVPGNAFEFWIDRETGLPLQMTIQHLSSKTPRRIIRSDFDFDTPLDEALFSTEAPEGYEVKRSVQQPDNQAMKKPAFVRHSYRQQLELSGEIKEDKRLEYLTPSIRRQVCSDGTIEVIDMSEVDLKILTLNPAEKSAVREVTVGFGIHEDPYCLGMMQQTAARDGCLDLGETMIEGRLAYGVKDNTFEIWADRESELPLLIIIQHHYSPEPRRIIMSEFDFTTPLDEALFSTDAPSGYSVEHSRK